MFCNQCEQTAHGTGCTKQGVCGKTASVAGIQDLLVYSLRGLAIVALEAGKKGLVGLDVGRLCAGGLFSTLTNVNFDEPPLIAFIDRVVAARKKLAAENGVDCNLPITTYEPAAGEALMAQAEMAGTDRFAPDPDCNALARTLLFGFKGVCAYTDHAAILGYEKPELYAAIYQGLAFGFDGKTPSLGEWLDAVMRCGSAAVMAMELLDAANTGVYGHPEPTRVSLRPVPGKAILVTGHDLKDLHDLLLQTEGKGINVYTHGEMLPTHAYPKLKAFSHFAGHYGTAWQNQRLELPHFPGPVLFTTNCIQRPAANYKDNVFTTGLVGWPETTHVENGKFGPVIDRALALEGFTAAQVEAMPDKSVMVGFARNTVLGIADKVVAAVKSGAIRHFFLVGGCDGAKPERNYYTEFVEKTPSDTVVLTVACGKFRFFDQQLGDIDGIPRLLDAGQCNDAYSTIKIAQALADAFSCDVNALPLSLVLSWYEQKAVAVLLALLSLGIRNIRLGPTLPAFFTPAIVDTLVKKFNISLVMTPDEDLASILGTKK